MKINSREKLFCNSGCPLYLLIIEIKKNSFFVQIFFFPPLKCPIKRMLLFGTKKEN